ncbi:unnamed protein product [Caenorhabditis angaria]|uniref:E3 ubiquitin-protein ligase n=1 Tax=Caenorhabditis angaria TaxID=860376 RepID=A0A9P1ISH9_9PELO|nr:unnamed protein product [Caenorhabditis angaria]
MKKIITNTNIAEREEGAIDDERSSDRRLPYQRVYEHLGRFEEAEAAGGAELFIEEQLRLIQLRLEANRFFATAQAEAPRARFEEEEEEEEEIESVENYREFDIRNVVFGRIGVGNNMSNNINQILQGNSPNGAPPGLPSAPPGLSPPPNMQQHQQQQQQDSCSSSCSGNVGGQQQQQQPQPQGTALPQNQHGKTFARVQGTAPVVSCTPSAATHSVAPHIALVGPTGDDSNAEVLSVFECPVCLEYMLPPYMQCQSGHLVCSNCRPKLQCCPTCRGPTPSVRNLGLEKIANTVRFPCKFSNSGCALNFHHYEKVEHEELCEYRPYSCPCPGASCKWQGGLPDVMDHLKRVHKSITTLQGEDIVFLATDINLPGAVDWVMMQSCFEYNFMLVLEKQEKYDPSQGQQMFYAVVQLIGSKKEADNFMYRLELSTQRRRMCWEATPRSIHEGVAYAIQQSDCLAFDTNAAQLFSENGNLGINVTISRVDGNARDECQPNLLRPTNTSITSRRYRLEDDEMECVYE